MKFTEENIDETLRTILYECVTDARDSSTRLSVSVLCDFVEELLASEPEPEPEPESEAVVTYIYGKQS